MNVVKLDHDAWKAFQGYARQVLDGAKEHGADTREALAWDRKFLGSCDLGERFNCEFYGLELDGQIVSINAVYFGTKKRGVWGKYLTAHFAYTLFGMRRLGYGGRLFRYIEKDAADRGIARVQSLAGSYAGFRLHLTLGHTFWGRDPRGYIVVDSPLSPAHVAGQRFIDGSAVPAKVARFCARVEDRPRQDQLAAWLTDPAGIFRANEDDARAAMTRHGLET